MPKIESYAAGHAQLCRAGHARPAGGARRSTAACSAGSSRTSRWATWALLPRGAGRATPSPGSAGRCRAGGPPGVLGRLPGRRRRRRVGREGRGGRRQGRGRAVRRDGARPDGRDPGPDRRPGQPLAGRHDASAPSARTSPARPIWNELITPDLPTATRVLLRGARRRLGGACRWRPATTTPCLIVDGRQVGGAMPPQMEGIPPHWNVYFNVEDVDDTVAKAERARRRVVAPAFDVPGVGRMAVLADPQGGDVQPDAEPADRPRAGSGSARRGTGRRGRRRGSSRRW